jgi:hypothetical protein
MKEEDACYCLEIVFEVGYIIGIPIAHQINQAGIPIVFSVMKPFGV